MKNHEIYSFNFRLLLVLAKGYVCRDVETVSLVQTFVEDDIVAQVVGIITSKSI